MNQQQDAAGQRQSQSQSQSQSQRRTDGPFVDDTKRAGGGLHPGSDRDDYGSPHGHQDTVASDPSGQVGGDAQPWRERVGGDEQERLEPGQVGQGDADTPGDTGAPAGYGDRGRGGSEPGRSWPGRDEQQGRIDPRSEHARQAEQGEASDGAGRPHGDYDIG